MRAIDPPDFCVCTTLRKASRALSRVYDKALEPSGLTTVQFSILRALERQDELRLTELAAAMVMDRTSLYRTLSPMERQGWLAIRSCGRGKAKLAALAPEGRARLADAAPLWAAAQQNVLASVGEQPWRLLRGTLDALTIRSAA